MVSYYIREINAKGNPIIIIAPTKLNFDARIINKYTIAAIAVYIRMRYIGFNSLIET